MPNGSVKRGADRRVRDFDVGAAVGECGVDVVAAGCPV